MSLAEKSKLRELSVTEIEEIVKIIVNRTAILDYYNALYAYFIQKKFSKTDMSYEYLCTADTLKQPIFNLVNLGINIPKNKKLSTIIEEEKKFIDCLLGQLLQPISEEKKERRGGSAFIDLIDSIQNQQLMDAITEYEKVLADVNLKLVMVKRIQNSMNAWSCGEEDLDKGFEQVHSLTGTLCEATRNGPDIRVCIELIDFLKEKAKQGIISVEQFEQFTQAYITRLLEIGFYHSTTYCSNDLVFSNINTIIHDLYEVAEVKEIIERSYANFFADMMNVKYQEDIANFLKGFFANNKSEGDPFYDKMSYITIDESITKSCCSKMACDYIGFIFSQKTIVPENSSAHFIYALRTATKNEKTLIPTILKVPMPINEEMLKEIALHLAEIEDPFGIIRGSAIGTLEERFGSNPNNNGKISKLIAMIEENSNEHPKATEDQKSRGQKTINLPTSPLAQ